MMSERTQFKMDIRAFRQQWTKALIRDLLWCRKYHLSLAKDIDKELMKLSKKYDIIINVEE